MVSRKLRAELPRSCNSRGDARSSTVIAQSSILPVAPMGGNVSSQRTLIACFRRRNLACAPMCHLISRISGVATVSMVWCICTAFCQPARPSDWTTHYGTSFSAVPTSVAHTSLNSWATRFILRIFLDRNIVVLLGYSADDPPIRYLLEGLNLAGRIWERRLYAFAAGEPTQITADSRERGVTAIAYDPVEQHRHLWESIHLWAKRARDPAGWRKRVDRACSNSASESQSVRTRTGCCTL